MQVRMGVGLGAGEDGVWLGAGEDGVGLGAGEDGVGLVWLGRAGAT